jgi:HK97 family phage prohead protease
MTSLYGDTGPPVRVEGYASIFNVVYQYGAVWHRISPGAFDCSRYEPFVAFMHDRSHRLAWTRNKTLRLWQDSHGLAFQFDLPTDHAGLSLALGIRAGNFRGVSFGSPPDGIRDFTTSVEAGRTIRIFEKMRIDEVSIVADPANFETCCWLDCEEPEDLPPHIRDARAKWHAGRLQAAAKPVARSAPLRATAYGRAAVRPPTAVLARIDAALALPRPPAPPPDTDLSRLMR